MNRQEEIHEITAIKIEEKLKATILSWADHDRGILSREIATIVVEQLDKEGCEIIIGGELLETKDGERLFVITEKLL